jgi:hypothetical protein
MSGQANVLCWLDAHGIGRDPELVQAIFLVAKESKTTLPESAVLDLCRSHART